MRAVPDWQRGKKVCMLKFIPTASMLGLLSLCFAGSNCLAGEPTQGPGQPPRAGQQPQRSLVVKNAALLFREDCKLAKDVPNVNTPDEPEHTIGQGDVANAN